MARDTLLTVLLAGALLAVGSVMQPALFICLLLLACAVLALWAPAHTALRRADRLGRRLVADVTPPAAGRDSAAADPTRKDA